MKKILSILYTASAILLCGCGDDTSTSVNGQIAGFSSAEETSSSSFKDNAVSSSGKELSTTSSSSAESTSYSLVFSSGSETTLSYSEQSSSSENSPSRQSSSSKISSLSRSSSSLSSSSDESYFEESSSATVSSSSLFSPCSEASTLKENWKYLNSDIQYGCIMDSRDNQYYATVKIGDYTWMAENLAYDYRDAPSVVYSWYGYSTKGAQVQSQRGYLYTWDLAMADTNCYHGKLCKPRGQKRGICPEGFHIPSYFEWHDLFNAVGDENVAARNLKSAEVWNDTAKGTNKYGFSVIPNGPRYGSGFFNPVDFNTVFWTSIESGVATGVVVGLTGDDKVSSFLIENKEFAFSVRCLMDYPEQETPHSGIPHDPDKIYQCDEMLMDDINTWHFKTDAFQEEFQYFIDDSDSISVRIKDPYSEYTSRTSRANNEDDLYLMFWTAMNNCKW